jgi:LPXTG-motif cell wall-anchored protein
MNTSTRFAALVTAALVAWVTLVGGMGASAQQTPGLNVNITVNGPTAPAVLAGLTVEVFGDPGGVEVSPLSCSTTPAQSDPFIAERVDDCQIDPGDYVIGLDGVPDGWIVSGQCNNGGQVLNEPLDLGGSESFSYFGGTRAQCSLFVNASTLLVDKVVVGGSAESSDFVIEVLDGEGMTVASGSDVADATCEADFDTAKCGVIAVPAGTGFFIAEPSVADYELTSVECDEFVYAAEAPEGGAVVSDIGEDGFRTDDGDTYCVVTNTYVPPTTTTSTTSTTTTTTVALTTTVSGAGVATTTVAPTTTIDAGVVTLPQTGTSESANMWMAIVATLLVGAGGAMLLARRRAD